MAAAPAYESAAAILSPPSEVDTLNELLLDDDARAKDEYINSHPLVASLRADPNYVESRPHMRIPTPWRKHNLTGGTLLGPGKMTILPYGWARNDGKSYVQITHVGTDLCGHVGIIHGGFLATMLDEGLARCCFPVLPFNIGMTAKLEIDYKAPAMADQFLVLRARTVKVEGRKAWVEGHIETLPAEEGQEPAILATASALFISPRQAAVRAPTVRDILMTMTNSIPYHRRWPKFTQSTTNNAHNELGLSLSRGQWDSAVVAPRRSHVGDGKSSALRNTPIQTSETSGTQGSEQHNRMRNESRRRRVVGSNDAEGRDWTLCNVIPMYRPVKIEVDRE
ncbi:hypothetical protein VTJ49DRAFT_2434 [Mycothermus thermophilus]|uniref:Thioesterase domain-containing protein n=1 Tax=Humicola insolens TaxID=85995 RepID=A0ABR3VA58_HUMIN